MKKAVYIALLLVLVIGIFAYLRGHQSKSAIKLPFVNDWKPVSDIKVYDAIDGEKVARDAAETRSIGVMVENYPDARPQSGLVDADIVYEAPTEGGITRFLALFQTKAPKNIGPIRSARTYFAEIADEWSALFAHVGGNSDALANIKAGVYKHISDADQFFNDPYFQRISQRPMPHNVYTSIDKLSKLISAHQFSDAASFEPWQFKDDSLAASTTAANIIVDFSLSEYKVIWQYEKSNNSYLRVLAGKPHKDLDTGKQIETKNIIVQFVKIFPVKSDTPLSIGMDLQAGGKAYVFQDGKITIGTWMKTANRTRYFDQNGQEISLNRGQIWVELVPEGQTVSWS